MYFEKEKTILIKPINTEIWAHIEFNSSRLSCFYFGGYLDLKEQVKISAEIFGLEVNFGIQWEF